MFKKNQKKTNQLVPRRRLPEYSIEDGRRGQASDVAAPNPHYRRNQTVSSYKRSEAGESERQKSHNLVLQRRKLGLVFLTAAGVVVLLFIGLWQFIAKPVVAFSDTEITQTVDANAYEESIAEYVGRNPSQRLRATLNEDTLTQYVSEAHGEVASVELANSVTLPSQVRFTISFRKPVASWQIRGDQYYVDRDGVVFSKNYFATPGVRVVDESGIAPEQGSAVASSKLLGFLGKVVDQAKGRGYTVSEAILPADTTRRVDVKLEGGETRIRFSTDRGVGVQVEDMDRALKYFAAHGNTPQYIDVRVAGRAAYK